MRSDSPWSITAEPDENDIMLWYAIILGPDDTPWEGGVFKLKFVFPQDYP